MWRPGRGKERGMLGKQRKGGGLEARIDRGQRERPVRLTGPPGSRKRVWIGSPGLSASGAFRLFISPVRPVPFSLSGMCPVEIFIANAITLQAET